MVKEFKAWKITWQKNDDSQGGSQNEAIRKCKEDEVIIKSQTIKNGSIWANVKPEQFLGLITTNKGLYEVITKFPHKVYFDIDKKAKQLFWDISQMPTLLYLGLITIKHHFTLF